jgi:hypothetical protein
LRNRVLHPALVGSVCMLVCMMTLRRTESFAFFLFWSPRPCAHEHGHDGLPHVHGRHPDAALVRRSVHTHIRQTPRLPASHVCLCPMDSSRTWLWRRRMLLRCPEPRTRTAVASLDPPTPCLQLISFCWLKTRPPEASAGHGKTPGEFDWARKRWKAASFLSSSRI